MCLSALKPPSIALCWALLSRGHTLIDLADDGCTGIVRFVGKGVHEKAKGKWRIGVELDKVSSELIHSRSHSVNSADKR